MTRCPRPHHPRFEAPVLAFVVVGLTGFACLFVGAWVRWVVG